MPYGYQNDTFIGSDNFYTLIMFSFMEKIMFY